MKAVSKNDARKVSFGRRKKGKYKKTRGPKEKRVKKYKRQGRR